MIGCEIAFQLSLAAYIVTRPQREPAVRTSWFLVVLVAPLIGGIIYLIFGNLRLPKKKRHRYENIRETMKQRASEGSWCPDGAGDPCQRVERGIRLAESLGSLPARAGNRLELFDETPRAVARLVEDIEGASRSVHLLAYIYLDDNSGTAVGEALMRAAGRGVRCRVLLDQVGSYLFLKSDLRERMEAKGVEVAEAVPVYTAGLRHPFERFDHRNHRKLAVIDGVVGWTGSLNVADPEFRIKAKFAPWVDVAMRFEGPAVYDLQGLFIENWLADTDSDEVDELWTPQPEPLPGGKPLQIMGTGPHLPLLSLRMMAVYGFGDARQELVITTPYFMPDHSTMTSLIAAVRSGVRVVLIVPARNDSKLVHLASRSLYEPFLEAGGEIYEYTKGLLHSKTVVIDRRIAVISTANLDRRSFELNFELQAHIFCPEETERVRAIQERYLQEAVPVRLDEWHARPRHTEWAQNAVGLMAPLL
ncbi:MAG: cardiolipin synthase [Sumerlaeia bacterium]